MYNYSSTNYNSPNRGQIRVRDKDQPLDTVSCLIWDIYRQQPSFFACSWDGYVRYYQLRPGTSSGGEVQKLWQMFLQHPVLCCDINQNSILFVGMATGDIAAINLPNNEIVRIGYHDAPISGVFWIKEKGCLMTLGFDNLVRFWDVNSNKNTFQIEVQLPLKTHTASFDYPFLLIGSCESTIAIINLKNLPNVKFPKFPNEYIKTNIEKFSKFNCSRILAQGRKLNLGTVDGRTITSSFKEGYDSYSLVDSIVSRSQKKADSRIGMYGQVDCVDIGYHNYETFSLIGGSDDLSSYNTFKRSKGHTYSNCSTSVGACTAVRLSPRLEYIAYATGSDWSKGIHELQNMKKPKICIAKLSSSDLKELTTK